MDMGSLTYTQVLVRVVHTKCGDGDGGGKGSGTNKSAQELTLRDRIYFFSLCHARGSNSGSSDLEV